MEGMKESCLAPTIFYYNPNIHPQEEYLIRKDENKRFAEKLGLSFVDADYSPEEWAVRTKGLEEEPERGARCSVCFLMRMERTALYAHENDFSVFATSLGISRHKNQVQVYAQGHAAALAYPDLVFWDYNWRCKGGAARGEALAKQEAFYRQNYCGCVYSLRDRQKRQEVKKK